VTFIRLNDGTVAHVRQGKRAQKITERDKQILEDYRRELLDAESILLTCQTCGGRYYVASVDALLYRSCLCGGELRAL
jgi:hypothetical protein